MVNAISQKLIPEGNIYREMRYGITRHQEIEVNIYLQSFTSRLQKNLIERTEVKKIL